MDRPEKSISPKRAGTMPESARTVVLFPAPLAPRRDTMRFSSTLREMPLRARIPHIAYVKFIYFQHAVLRFSVSGMWLMETHKGPPIVRNTRDALGTGSTVPSAKFRATTSVTGFEFRARCVGSVSYSLPRYAAMTCASLRISSGVPQAMGTP